MTKNSGSQVYAGQQPTRERVGLVVDGTNAAAAINTIIAGQKNCLVYARYGWRNHLIGQIY